MKKAKAIAALFLILIFTVWIINAYIVVRAKSYIYKDLKSVPQVEAVLIPGASVYRSGELSPVLKQRVETGIRFIFKHEKGKILFSGHVVPNGYNEPAAMAAFALKRLVPKERIIQDSSGRSTYKTILNCRERFKFDTVLIVTQEYHLPRALYIAHNLGLQAYGQIAPYSMRNRKNVVREFFSRQKDFFLLKVFKLFRSNNF